MRKKLKKSIFFKIFNFVIFFASETPLQQVLPALKANEARSDHLRLSAIKNCLRKINKIKNWMYGSRSNFKFSFKKIPLSRKWFEGRRALTPYYSSSWDDTILLYESFLFINTLNFCTFALKFAKKIEKIDFFQNFQFYHFFRKFRNSFVQNFTSFINVQCQIWPARNLDHTKLCAENKFIWNLNVWNTFKFQIFFQKTTAESQVVRRPLSPDTVLLFEWDKPILLYESFVPRYLEKSNRGIRTIDKS